MASISPSPTNLCHLLQMASVSPFPISSTNNIASYECKFLGTLMFNHLPPSYYEWQTGQYNSSDLRRLNRWICCTSKFSLSFYSRHAHRDSQLLKVDQELARQILLLSNGLLTRVSLLRKNFRLQRPKIISMVPNISSRLSMPSFMPSTTSLLSQLLKCLKINYTRSKVNCDQYTIKLQYFCQHQHFEVISIIWSRADHDSPSLRI